MHVGARDYNALLQNLHNNKKCNWINAHMRVLHNSVTVADKPTWVSEKTRLFWGLAPTIPGSHEDMTKGLRSSGSCWRQGGWNDSFPSSTWPSRPCPPLPAAMITGGSRTTISFHGTNTVLVKCRNGVRENPRVTDPPPLTSMSNLISWNYTSVRTYILHLKINNFIVNTLNSKQTP